MGDQSKLTAGMVFKGFKSQYTIVDVISEKGGQGGVYKAKDLKGNIWAIKWYWHDDKAQKQRIQDLYMKGMPPAIQSLTQCKFIWPRDIIQNNESFGYVMECLNLKNYDNFESVIMSKRAIDFEVIARISINICKGFDKLHSSGYCYKDISGGNIHFDLKSYDIIVMDVDNIRPDVKGEKSDVDGTEGFIAPEIVRGECEPNKISDRFSIAVMLFSIWCKQNPFQGTKVVMYEGKNPIVDLYSYPVFIFHPTDKSNTAERDPNESWAKGMFNFVRAWWEAIPSLLKVKFTEVFTDGLDPQKRKTTESDWIKLFDRLLSEGYFEKCKKCGNQIAVESSSCIFCGTKHNPHQPNKPEVGSLGGGPIQVATKTAPSLKHCIEVTDNGVQIATIELKLGKIITGKEISPKIEKLGNVIEICSKPGDDSLLALRNLTYYNWTIYFNDDDAKHDLPYEKAVLIRKVEKIILPANLTLYIHQ